MPDSLDLTEALVPPMGAPVASSNASTSSLVLDPPAPVPVISHDQADAMVPVDPATRTALQARAAAWAADLAELTPHSPEFAARIADVSRMGDTEMRASTAVTNAILDQPGSSLAAALGRGEAGNAQAKVARTLLDLRTEVTELDPGRADLSGARRVLGLIPHGTRLAAYFHKYQSAQTQIDAIIRALSSGQDELRRDNASIEQEKVNLWTLMGKLTEYVTLAAALDTQVQAQVDELRSTKVDAANALTADAVFPIRQRRQDLLTQLAVAVQGYLALDLVRKNNLELIKGVDRAETTTIAALRTAVIVAQALANQKLVLEQVNALNTTTNNLILGTSELLKQQSSAIYDQASSASVSVDTLQKAFDNVFSTMDAIDSYKVQAVTAMDTTVTALQSQIARSQSYLQRVHAADTAANS